MVSVTTINNDERVGERRFRAKARTFLNKLAIELSKERPGIQYVVLNQDSGTEDPAQHVSLVQLGPEKRFLGGLKKTRIISARCSDYKNHNYNIQIDCYDSSLEARAIAGFEDIGQTENGQSVHVWRHGYSL